MTMEQKIRASLQSNLQPTVIKIDNISARHKGHSGDDGSGESHFEVMVIGNCFETKSRIERHRMIFGVLQNDIKKLPHALSIKALTEDEAENIEVF